MDWTNIYKKKVMYVTDAIDAVIKDCDTVALGGLVIAVAQMCIRDSLYPPPDPLDTRDFPNIDTTWRSRRYHFHRSNPSPLLFQVLKTRTTHHKS